MEFLGREIVSGNPVWREGEICNQGLCKKTEDCVFQWNISSFDLNKCCELRSPTFFLKARTCFFRFRHVTTFNQNNPSWNLYLSLEGPFGKHCFLAKCRSEFFTGVEELSPVLSYPSRQRERVKEIMYPPCSTQSLLGGTNLSVLYVPLVCINASAMKREFGVPGRLCVRVSLQLKERVNTNSVRPFSSCELLLNPTRVGRHLIPVRYQWDVSPFRLQGDSQFHEFWRSLGDLEQTERDKLLKVDLVTVAKAQAEGHCYTRFLNVDDAFVSLLKELVIDAARIVETNFLCIPPDIIFYGFDMYDGSDREEISSPCAYGSSHIKCCAETKVRNVVSILNWMVSGPLARAEKKSNPKRTTRLPFAIVKKSKVNLSVNETERHESCGNCLKQLKPTKPPHSQDQAMSVEEYWLQSNESAQDSTSKIIICGCGKFRFCSLECFQDHYKHHHKDCYSQSKSDKRCTFCTKTPSEIQTENAHNKTSKVADGSRDLKASVDSKKDEEEEEMPRLLFCRQCRVAAYCDRKCQKKDWKQHKNKCAHLKRSKVDSIAYGNITTAYV